MAYSYLNIRPCVYFSVRLCSSHKCTREVYINPSVAVGGWGLAIQLMVLRLALNSKFEFTKKPDDGKFKFIFCCAGGGTEGGVEGARILHWKFPSGLKRKTIS